MTKYYLDPDYRKSPDCSKPFCIRCQKPIKDVSKAILVSYVGDCYVIEGGKHLIGSDCWKKITKVL